MSVNVNAGKNGIRVGCLSTPFVGTLLIILILLSIYEMYRMRQDLNLLKQAYTGTAPMVELIRKAKVHTDNARREILNGKYGTANDQMVLAGDTLNEMDESLRETQQTAQRQYPSLLDWLATGINYVVNLLKGLFGR